MSFRTRVRFPSPPPRRRKLHIACGAFSCFAFKIAASLIPLLRLFPTKSYDFAGTPFSTLGCFCFLVLCVWVRNRVYAGVTIPVAGYADRSLPVHLRCFSISSTNYPRIFAGFLPRVAKPPQALNLPLGYAIIAKTVFGVEPAWKLLTHISPR